VIRGTSDLSPHIASGEVYFASNFQQRATDKVQCMYWCEQPAPMLPRRSTCYHSTRICCVFAAAAAGV